MSAVVRIALRLAGLLALVAANAFAVSFLTARVLGRRRAWRPLAAARRLLSKEDLSASAADARAFRAVPALLLLASFVALAPLSLSASVSLGSPDAGILVTVAALALVPVSLLVVARSAGTLDDRAGAMRAAASRAAWCVPLALSLVTPVMVAGSLEPLALVEAQRGTWLFGLLPRWFALSPHAAAFALFAISAYLLVAPSLREAGADAPGTGAYTGGRAAVTRLAEATLTFAVCALATTVFFGGWLVPFADRHPIAGVLGPPVFLLKTYALMYVLVRVRAALPRVAHVRPVSFAWTRLVPLSIVLIVVYAAVARGGGL